MTSAPPLGGSASHAQRGTQGRKGMSPLLGKLVRAY